MSDFKDEPIEEALQLIRDQFDDYFKYYSNGFMDNIPQSLLPCVMATTLEGDTSASNTAQDNIDERIGIVVVLNKKDFIGDQGETNLADLALRRLVKGQDSVTGMYMKRTVLYALRYNFTMNNNVVDNAIQFEFSPNQRGQQLFTQEAFITLTVRHKVTIGPRQ